MTSDTLKEGIRAENAMNNALLKSKIDKTTKNNNKKCCGGLGKNCKCK